MADNAMTSFFRKYNAVPADDAGPRWSQATDDALLNWFRQYRGVVVIGWNHDARREATAGEREAMRPAYHEIAAEVTARARRPNASAAVLAAHLMVHGRFPETAA